MRIIDISIPVTSDMVVWPGNENPIVRWNARIQSGDGHNESAISMNMHAGTHVDAPLHFLEDKAAMQHIPLEHYYGDVEVVDLSSCDHIDEIALEPLADTLQSKRVLFKTKNSKRWQDRETDFDSSYVGITHSGAKWLADRDMVLVGNDYLSVAKMDEAPEVHRILLAKEIVLLEGINLSDVEPGIYTLAAFPVYFKDTEAAPVRAVLIAE